MNIFSLRDRTIVVTGASSGIGRAVSVACDRAGASVVLIGRDETRLAETRGMCKNSPLVWPCDLSDLDAAAKVVRSIVEQTGPLSGLVHCAGIYRNCPLRAVRGKTLRSIMDINAFSGVMLTKGLAMKENALPGASVVLFSSVMGHVGQQGLVGYCMSKGAVEQATKALALELQKDEIRVNAVSPATIQTPMSEKMFSVLDEHQREAIGRAHPGGLGSPEDTTGAVVFLLSEASRYVTGTSILVDGGYCAQ